MTRSILLFNQQQGHLAFTALWSEIKALLAAGHRLVITVREETRTLEQNSRMWAMLTDVSKQVDWYGKRLDPEDWKHVFSASLRKLEVVPNLEGTGFVALGLSTSKMTKAQMTDLMELMAAFGAEKGVRWSDPALPAEPQRDPA